MGRILSDSSALGNNDNVMSGIVSATKNVPAGYMGEFGNGLWWTFSVSGKFVVPAGVSKLRVRVVGAGGGRGTGGVGGGGGGGGYAHGVFGVTAGQSFVVTVGVGGNSVDGGSSSFGALISATGGKKGNSSSPYNGGAGGVGVGGDFQSKGGKGGTGDSSGTPGGGGAAGSQLGDGGDGGDWISGSNGGGGGGVGGGKGGNATGAAGGGGSPFGNATLSTPAPDIIGGISSGVANPISAVIRFPFDGFTGGGGSNGKSPGPGGGGYAGETPGLGGGGGQGGGGGGQVLASNASQFGNPGLVIVEW